LDINKDGYITYNEFCGMCEEKRRNIDPFDHEDALKQINQRYESTKRDLMTKTIE